MLVLRSHTISQFPFDALCLEIDTKIILGVFYKTKNEMFPILDIAVFLVTSVSVPLTPNWSVVVYINIMVLVMSIYVLKARSRILYCIIIYFY